MCAPVEFAFVVAIRFGGGEADQFALGEMSQFAKIYGADGEAEVTVGSELAGEFEPAIFR